MKRPHRDGETSCARNLLSKIRAFFGRRESTIERLIAKGLVIGESCSIQGGVVFDESHCWLIQIGNRVSLAPYVYLLAHDASMVKHLGVTRIGKIIIGDRVFVGARTIILPGVTIGADSVIGAGSVVTKSIPAGVVAAGNPAKVICDLATFVARHKENGNKLPVFSLEERMRSDHDAAFRAEMLKRMDQGVGYTV